MNQRQTLQRLRENSRLDIVLPKSGLTMTIRKLTHIELNGAQMAGILPAADSPTPQPNLSPVNAAILGHQMAMNMARYVLLHGVVMPRVVFQEESEADVPEDCCDARWIAEDSQYLVEQVLRLSGFSEATQEEVKEVTKNEKPSGSMTLSPEDTAGCLMKSSISQCGNSQ